jgi:hypothetical protein
MLFAPVPGLPMLPVINARLMMACACACSRGFDSRPSSTRTKPPCHDECFRAAIDFADGQTRLGRDLVRRELAHELGKLRVARRALRDELVVHPAVLHEQIRETVEQREIGLGRERRCCVAFIAVSVRRGSMTMMCGLFLFRNTRCHMIGCAMHGFAPMKINVSLNSKSA